MKIDISFKKTQQKQPNNSRNDLYIFFSVYISIHRFLTNCNFFSFQMC